MTSNRIREEQRGYSTSKSGNPNTHARTQPAYTPNTTHAQHIQHHIRHAPYTLTICTHTLTNTHTQAHTHTHTHKLQTYTHTHTHTHTHKYKHTHTPTHPHTRTHTHTHTRTHIHTCSPDEKSHHPVALVEKQILVFFLHFARQGPDGCFG